MTLYNFRQTNTLTENNNMPVAKALANTTHTANSAWAGDTGWNEMTNTNLSVTNSYSSGAYTAFFTGVKNCNVTLAGADLFTERYASAEDEKTVDYIRQKVQLPLKILYRFF